MIRAGKLDRRIGILRRVVTHNALNEEIETWTVLATHDAEAITAMSGSREFAALYKVYAEMGILFLLRYGADVTVLDKVSYGGRTFDILGVIDKDLHHVELYLVCKEVVG